MTLSNYFKAVSGGFVVGIGETSGEGNITREEYEVLVELFANAPTAPDGYIYMLTDKTHEWVLKERGGGN